MLFYSFVELASLLLRVCVERFGDKALSLSLIVSQVTLPLCSTMDIQNIEMQKVLEITKQFICEKKNPKHARFKVLKKK